jgi:hypothetical protein
VSPKIYTKTGKFELTGKEINDEKRSLLKGPFPLFGSYLLFQINGDMSGGMKF